MIETWLSGLIAGTLVGTLIGTLVGVHWVESRDREARDDQRLAERARQGETAPAQPRVLRLWL